MTIANRAKETSTSTGTENFTLDGASTGFETFANALAKIEASGPWDNVTYLITMGNHYEMGRTRFTSPSTLTRDAGTLTTILASSNSDARVDWGSGTKNVVITAAAEDIYPHIYGKVALTGGHSVATGLDKIFDSSYNVPYDVGNWWDSATNHRLDISRNCLVHISLYVVCLSTTFFPHIYVNGTSTNNYTGAGAPSASIAQVSASYKLNDGDYVEFFIENTGAATNAMGTTPAPYRTQAWWRVEEYT